MDSCTVVGTRCAGTDRGDAQRRMGRSARFTDRMSAPAKRPESTLQFAVASREFPVRCASREPTKLRVRRASRGNASSFPGANRPPLGQNSLQISQIPAEKGSPPTRPTANESVYEPSSRLGGRKARTARASPVLGSLCLHETAHQFGSCGRLSLCAIPSVRLSMSRCNTVCGIRQIH